MTTMRNPSIRPRTATLTLAALGVTLALLAPAASAHGWLVNVEVGPVIGSGNPIDVKLGEEFFGREGDTVDVGVLNHQCTDEEDTVDVGVMNTEGDPGCDPIGTPGCEEDEGRPLPFVPLPPPPPDPAPHEGRCSDNGDTVDVGVMNNEGGMHRKCLFTENELGRDEGDQVDVGVLNYECRDDFDGIDVGLLNCEWEDGADEIDVGLLNGERHYDYADGIDVSVLNSEENDDPDMQSVQVGFEIIALWNLCALHI